MADFTKDEEKTKSMQQKVAQSMPMKAKKASLTTPHVSISVSTGAPINVVILDRMACPQTTKLDAIRTSPLNRRGE